MLTFRCPTCGRESSGGPEPCPDCGGERPPGVSLPRDPHHLVTWTGVVVIALSLVVLSVVGVAFVTRTPARTAAAPPSTTSSTTATTTTLPPDEPIQALELVDVPVTEPVTLERPPLGGRSRIHHDGQIVVLGLTGDVCTLTRGTLTIAGTVTNDSPVDQTLTFLVEAEATRPTTGTRLVRREVELVAVAPGETRTWQIEASSPRTVKIRCAVTAVTVTPAETG